MLKLTRPQKISFAEMRAAGVHGVLIYCADYKCSHWTTISGDRWPMTSDCPTSSRASPVKSAAREALMSARISIGSKRPGTR